MPDGQLGRAADEVEDDGTYPWSPTAQAAKCAGGAARCSHRIIDTASAPPAGSVAWSACAITRSQRLLTVSRVAAGTTRQLCVEGRPDEDAKEAG